MVIKISCFKLGPNATIKILAGTGIDISDMEARIASDPVPVSVSLKDRSLRCSVVVKKDSIAVRNVVGVIHGKDSTRSLIVGAHYDHLGMRHGKIFNGADDNASGTAGMLALAKVWGACRKQPACNLVFAAWTAEEKGLLGSSYFAEHSGVTAGNTLLYINMDMISRSAPEDTCQKILSIGTLPAGDGLRQIAGAVNRKLPTPFELDLWDVTGHTGSDYASFTAQKVPVMTFFSGFQADYHTPADTFARVDARKMENVLKLVNGCIFYFIENYRVR
jgi:Zn-dependent M28 family amino/carboxypeptidase